MFGTFFGSGESCFPSTPSHPHIGRQTPVPWSLRLPPNHWSTIELSSVARNFRRRPGWRICVVSAGHIAMPRVKPDATNMTSIKSTLTCLHQSPHASIWRAFTFAIGYIRTELRAHYGHLTRIQLTTTTSLSHICVAYHQL